MMPRDPTGTHLAKNNLTKVSFLKRPMWDEFFIRLNVRANRLYKKTSSCKMAKSEQNKFIRFCNAHSIDSKETYIVFIVMDIFSIALMIVDGK